jgi:hypothetical protein
VRSNLSCQRIEARGEALGIVPARVKSCSRGSKGTIPAECWCFLGALSPDFVTEGVIHSPPTSSSGSTSRASASLRMVRG